LIRWLAACRASAGRATLMVSLALAACQSDADTETPSAENLAINELSAAGTEWLELYHSGSGDLDLGQYGLTDTDKTTGLPRVYKAMRFPAGTKLRAGGFLLVLLGKADSAAGPYGAGACLPDVDAGCFYASFSISEARGEAVHVITPDDAALLNVNFPANLAAPAGSNTTVCRLPDGTGELTACAPTPGAANAAP